MANNYSSMIPLSTTCERARSILRVGIKHHGLLPNYMNSRQLKISSKHRCKLHIIMEPPRTQFSTIDKLFHRVTKTTCNDENKVTVVGLDEIGIATVFALLAQNITNNICMIDLEEDILKGEHLDLQCASLFHNNTNIVASKDPAATANSKICIVITGTFRGPDEPASTYVARSIAIIKAIIPMLVSHSSNTVIIVASSPVDVLSYAAWKLSGLPKNHIIGTGTLLDTARFRYLISQKMGISPVDCHGFIIGEHGENSVPIWSGVNIAGVSLKDLNPDVGSENDGDNWREIYKEAVNYDAKIRGLKGHCAWSLALAIATVCKTILNNANCIFPVSTHVQGQYSIPHNVFLSMPCVVGRSGVTRIVRQTLTDVETRLLRKCAENVAGMQQTASKILS